MDMLLDLAGELRARAAKAAGKERDDLLFLAAEYEAMAAGNGRAAGEEGLSVIIPK